MQMLMAPAFREATRVGGGVRRYPRSVCNCYIYDYYFSITTTITIAIAITIATTTSPPPPTYKHYGAFLFGSVFDTKETRQ